MCFMDLPPKKSPKTPSKTTAKVSLEGARIILGPDGAGFSFPATSKLPSNLVVRQDFYVSDKFQTSTPSGTILTQLYGPCTPIPNVQAHYDIRAALLPTLKPATAAPPAAQPTSTDLITAVSEAQRLASNLKDACFSHSSCSSLSRSSHSFRSQDHTRDRDRDTLLLSIERKNAEEIAAIKLERDIESKIKDVVRDRDVQALMTVSGGGGGVREFGREGGGGNGGGNGAGNGLWGNGGFGMVEGAWSLGGRATSEMEREERSLRERERERDRGRDRDRRLVGAGRACGDAQTQFNLFQDLSIGGGGSRGGGGFMDGVRDGWERRRSSVASTLDRGARRLVETMARVEAEVDSMRKRERDRDNYRRRELF